MYSKIFLPLIVGGILFILTACPDIPRESLRTFPDEEREIYILNNLAETVSVYQPGTERLYNDVFTTGRVPNDMVYRNGRLYIVTSGDNEIEIFNESTFEKEGEIYLGQGRNPWMLITPLPGNGSTAFIPNFVASSVSVVDLVRRQVLTELTNQAGYGFNTPQGGCLSGGRVFICNTAHTAGMNFGEGNVTIFGTSDNYPLLQTLSTGTNSNPQTALAFPDKQEVHIYLSGSHSEDDGEILVLDTSGDMVVETARLPVGGAPSYSGSGYDEQSGLVFLTGTWGLFTYDSNNNLIDRGSSNPVIGLDTPSLELYSGVAVDIYSDIILLADFQGDMIRILNRGDYSSVFTLEGSDGPGTPVLVVE